MICPVDITYEPFACGPTVYVGNCEDGAAIAAELAVINADTMHDTSLDDSWLMKASRKVIQNNRTRTQHLLGTALSVVEARVVVMTAA
jgi:hypothetical protein